jgi:1-hydroxycarotenoid 3,4-desaturase
MSFDAPSLHPSRPGVLIVGAGIGGLAAALRLAATGARVTVLERHAHVGGKIRTLPSDAGPVDAGPTVLTMRPVFDDLFAAAGERLDDHLTLVPQDILARHVWPDGGKLDLFARHEDSVAAIRQFSGARSAAEFERFCARCRDLWDAFDAPMMQAARPTMGALVRHVAARPALIPRMAPLSTLAGLLKSQFSDPRLAQLFGRYATYVGGSPYLSPAVLALIWQAEAAGVWAVRGGMHRLAQAVADLARARGAEIRQKAHVAEILVEHGRAVGVLLQSGEILRADAVLFNGDPRALAVGQMGPHAGAAVPKAADAPRSFSARVHSFAARPSGFELAHHNVLFAADPASEFDDLRAGRQPCDPTLYLCAEDRGLGGTPTGPERFELIANAPPTGSDTPTHEDNEEWHRTIMRRMAGFGLSFDPEPDATTLTDPAMFHDLFPMSRGALYGQSPHGLMAAFKRPVARSAVRGLYLAGGGAHPGAGVPMATLSGRHAAEAIWSDLTSERGSIPTAMPGGMSTG